MFAPAQLLLQDSFLASLFGFCSRALLLCYFSLSPAAPMLLLCVLINEPPRAVI